MKTLFIHLFAFLFLSLIAYGETLNVPAEFSSIQSAINAAQNGDTVLVAEGTYYENINFSGKNILVASHFILENNPEFIHSTIIDGSQPVDINRASCVLIISGEDSSAVLEGFTLTGGKGIAWPDEHGNHETYTEGGGVFVALSSPTIRNNVIINNEAIRVTSGMRSAGGGAIRCGDGKPRIMNNIIADNRGLYGAGIVLNYCSGAVISNNIFYNNRVYAATAGAPTFGGGAIWIWNVLASDNTPHQIVNNTIVSNSATGGGSSWAGRGGGLLIAGSNATITNNIFWNNTQATGGQIYNPQSLAITYSLVQGGMAGEGNFDADPGFVEGSFQLNSNSPCIDKGNPEALYNDPEDVNNTGSALLPAQGSLRSDVGAFGGPGMQRYLDLITAVEAPEQAPQGFYLEQNYPNPFNPMTSMQFAISNRQFVRLKIFDILGKEVATLVNEEKLPGKYEVQFDASYLTSGVYFYELIAGKYSDTKKMLLLR